MAADRLSYLMFGWMWLEQKENREERESWNSGQFRPSRDAPRKKRRGRGPDRLQTVRRSL